MRTLVMVGLGMVFIAMSAGAKTIDVEAHGDCTVSTTIDDLTDKRAIQLQCKGQGRNWGGHFMVLQCRGKDEIAVGLKAGVQIHGGDELRVKYRFDKGKLYKGWWKDRKSFGLTWNKKIYQRFVDEIDGAKQLAYKVEDDAGLVDLSGGVEAVAEYKKRCAALGRAMD